MTSFVEVVEALMTPSIPVILLGLFIVLGSPVILHLILSASSTYTSPPIVVLLGPVGAGKTSLLTLFEHKSRPSRTHTSQRSHSVELNASTDSVSKTSFRNDEDSSGTHIKFLLIDTPGHAKLRNAAMGKLRQTDKLRAIVFMVDAAALSEPSVLGLTASYLYDLLLYLQKKSGDNARERKAIPLLIAANKMDLFTALPATLVLTQLENELTRIRDSRSRALLDSGTGKDEVGFEERDDWLGDFGSKKSTFGQMADFNIEIEVLGGSVTSEEADVDKWWWWIAQKV